MLLLLSVTQPGQNQISDLRSFAAFVHTKCAFIVSGAASNTFQPEVMSWPLELSKRNFKVSTRFISAFIKLSKS